MVSQWERPVPDAMAVFAGRRDISAVTAVAAGPLRPIADQEAWVDGPDERVERFAFRWARYPDGISS